MYLKKALIVCNNRYAPLWYIQTHNMSLRILRDSKKNGLNFQTKVFVQYTSSENKSLEEKSVKCASTIIYVSLWYIYGHSLKCVTAYLNAYAGEVIKTSKMSNKEKISTYFTHFKDNQCNQTTSDICIYIYIYIYIYCSTVCSSETS